jgi:hypothetical protein
MRGPENTTIASPPKRRYSRRPTARLRIAIWVVVPLLMLASVELVTRRVLRGQAIWYDREEEVVRRHTGPTPAIDALFIGTSRVQAAIDAKEFARILAGHLGREPVVLNFGMGHSTLTEHYWGVRNLIAAAAPDKLRGCTFFVELTCGLPQTLSWDDLPYVADQPQLMLPVLRRADLPRLWHAPIDVQGKLLLTGRWALHGSAALARGERVREQIVTRGARAAATLAERHGWASDPLADEGAADLSREGGIKVDARAVAAARDFATRIVERDLQDQTPVADWDKTVAHDLVEMVIAAGGQVVFFEAPMHRLTVTPYETAIRMEDRRRFGEAAARWQAHILSPDFHARDEDFPDIWHLSATQAKPYSAALAHAFLAMK